VWMQSYEEVRPVKVASVEADLIFLSEEPNEQERRWACDESSDLSVLCFDTLLQPRKVEDSDILMITNIIIPEGGEELHADLVHALVSTFGTDAIPIVWLGPDHVDRENQVRLYTAAGFAQAEGTEFFWKSSANFFWPKQTEEDSTEKRPIGHENRKKISIVPTPPQI